MKVTVGMLLFAVAASRTLKIADDRKQSYVRMWEWTSEIDDGETTPETSQTISFSFDVGAQASFPMNWDEVPFGSLSGSF